MDDYVDLQIGKKELAELAKRGVAPKGKSFSQEEAQHLLQEAEKQLKLREGLENLRLNHESLEFLTGAVIFENSPYPLVPLTFSHQDYVLQRKESSTLYTVIPRALIINNAVETDPQEKLDSREQRRAIWLRRNQRFFHTGFSTNWEYDLLVHNNKAIKELLKKSFEAGFPYSLFLSINMQDSAKKGKAYESRMPTIVVPGISDLEIRETILPAEAKRRQDIGYADRDLPYRHYTLPRKIGRGKL